MPIIVLKSEWLCLLQLAGEISILAEFVEQLPPDIQKEVKDFAEFLLEKRAKKEHKVPTFDWEGALKDLGEQYTSVELQHKILKMRGN